MGKLTKATSKRRSVIKKVEVTAPVIFITRCKYCWIQALWPQMIWLILLRCYFVPFIRTAFSAPFQWLLFRFLCNFWPCNFGPSLPQIHTHTHTPTPLSSQSNVQMQDEKTKICCPSHNWKDILCSICAWCEQMWVVSKSTRLCLACVWCKNWSNWIQIRSEREIECERSACAQTLAKRHYHMVNRCLKQHRKWLFSHTIYNI